MSNFLSLTRKVHQTLKRKKSESRFSRQRNTISITKKLKYIILTNLIMRFQFQRLTKRNNKRYIRQIYSYELRPFWSIKSQSITSFDVFFCQTRKHSSRMRSAHFPSSSGGAGSAQPPLDTDPLPLDADPPPPGCRPLPQDADPLLPVSTLAMRTVMHTGKPPLWMLVMRPLKHAGKPAPLPPMNRMIDRCKTLPCPRTSFEGGKNGKEHFYRSHT